MSYSPHILPSRDAGRGLGLTRAQGWTQTPDRVPILNRLRHWIAGATHWCEDIILSDPECCIPGLPDIGCLWPQVPAGVGWALDKQSQISRDNLPFLHTLMITDPAVRLGLIYPGQAIKEEPTWRELSENQSMDTASQYLDLGQGSEFLGTGPSHDCRSPPIFCLGKRWTVTTSPRTLQMADNKGFKLGPGKYFPPC